MAPRLRRAALHRFAAALMIVGALVLVLGACVAPVFMVVQMQLRLAMGLLGCTLLLGTFLWGLPQKKRSRVTAPRIGKPSLGEVREVEASFGV